MSEPEIDRDNPDAESMFDFLAEGGGDKRSRRKARQNDGERSLPIIRKPVPISQSGPLLPPKPGTPVEPPPQLTGSTLSEPVDDFDFLDNLDEDKSSPASARAPQPANLRPAAGRSANRVPESGNVTRFPSKKPQVEQEHARTQSRVQQRNSQDYLEKKAARFRTRPPGQQAKPNHQIADFDDFDLDTRDHDRFPNDWQEGIHAARIAENDGRDSSRSRWLVLAFVLIAAGMGSLLYKSPPLWLAERFSQTTASVEGSTTGSDEAANAAVLNQSDSIDGQTTGQSAGEIVVSPLMQRFTEQLSRIKALTDAGSLDEAEQALATLDRTVYGYGAYEFSELEARIAQIRSGAGDPAAAPAAAPQEEQEVPAQNTAQLESQQEEQVRLAAQAAAQAQAEREEQLRLSQEQALLEEQARLEQEQARLEEQARLDQEQAQLAEQARLDQEQAQLEEAWRAESQRVEEAERIEAAAVQEALRAAKAAQDLVAQQEQNRLEEQAQQAADTQARARQQAVDADRQATDRRIAEERAAVERQRARELRLVQAREREAAILSQQQTAPATIPAQNIELAVNEQASEPSSVETVVSGPQPITDEDLQQVYQQFSELQEAIRNRDINKVVGLTQRSGVRVQQFMQMFENSVEIDSRIQNVSTRNATGEISGTLRINTIRRNDGLIIEPPVSLSSIPLTSRRDGSGWSAILW